MQGLAVNPTVVGIIKIVPDKRITEISHVYSDLMGSACAELKKHQGKSFAAYKNPVLG